MNIWWKGNIYHIFHMLKFSNNLYIFYKYTTIMENMQLNV